MQDAVSAHDRWHDGRQSAESVREAERKHFDQRYAGDDEVLDTPEMFEPEITPEFRRGGVPGGLVHREVWRHLLAHGLQGHDVLDYASGAGHWGVRLAQEGARVRGFDLSPVGVERSNRRAEAARVDATFVCADAAKLPFPDESFDIVVGIRALHHVIKYPGTADELRRVMRPGAIALFAENIEGSWLLKLARRRTMRGEEQAGDVILTEPMIRTWGAGFADVQVERFKILLMAKRIGLPYQALAILHAIDLAVLKLAPFARRWCGECVVMLRRD